MGLFDLEGRVAIVTGGGTGIGAATAQVLAAQGADVAIAARTVDDLERTAAAVEGATGRRWASPTPEAGSPMLDNAEGRSRGLPAMGARRIRREKTSAAVVDYFLEQIFEGHLRSGDRIDLDRVADELGVSRLPVREALVVLERDGLVSTLPHRGTFVEPFDADSIDDDFEILGLLSGVAVARLARRRDPEVLQQLEALLDELRASPPDDIGRAVEIVQELVRAQHRAGGSRRLRAELRSYAGFLPWAFRAADDRPHDAIVRAHALVIEAIAAGDPDAAARHRVEDFRTAGQAVVRDLERRGVIEPRR